jgi:radical SAM protein with 4Fe4S-binding SPASM domain
MKRLEAAVIVTYRCMGRCVMCNTWQFPTSVGEEFPPVLLEKLPRLSFCNITGGEPFLRDDIEKIIQILANKSNRLVISTNGYLVDRILDAARKHPNVGFRISMEGLSAANNILRGLDDGFDRGLRTVLGLKRLGVKDVGFGITVSDGNARDMLELYQLAKLMRVEFATAVVHNSYYFHTYENAILEQASVKACFEELIAELLATWRIKNWFRAYFNHGLIRRVAGQPRLLPCRAGTDFFFLDPGGEVRPCNGMDERVWCVSMGNLTEQSFEEIWSSPRASEIRDRVGDCDRNCWMIGSASPAIRRHLWQVGLWVIRNKLRAVFGRVS